jgi:hypothetical protein
MTGSQRSGPRNRLKAGNTVSQCGVAVMGCCANFDGGSLKVDPRGSNKETGTYTINGFSEAPGAWRDQKLVCLKSQPS